MVTQQVEANDADIVELLNVWSDISVNLMQTQQSVDGWDLHPLS